MREDELQSVGRVKDGCLDRRFPQKVSRINRVLNSPDVRLEVVKKARWEELAVERPTKGNDELALPSPPLRFDFSLAATVWILFRLAEEGEYLLRSCFVLASIALVELQASLELTSSSSLPSVHLPSRTLD